MQICEYVNVCRMWETPEKCGKLAKKCGKRVDKMWECGKHVENSKKMWKTCGKLICTYKCAIFAPTIQT